MMLLVLHWIQVLMVIQLLLVLLLMKLLDLMVKVLLIFSKDREILSIKLAF